MIQVELEPYRVTQAAWCSLNSKLVYADCHMTTSNLHLIHGLHHFYSIQH